MWNLKSIETLNRDKVTLDSVELLKCRAECLKNCCINCNEFLTCEVSPGKPGLLLNLTCTIHFNEPIDMESGVNSCTKYETPRYKL